MGLTFAPGVPAFVASLAPAPKKAIRRALDVLKKDARGAPGLNVRRLDGPHGSEPIYRIRVGEYRIAYGFDGRLVRIVLIFHRRDGYGWLERY